jgi:type I restriction enzyme S subunit
MSLPEETFNVVRLSEVATITDSLHSTPAYSLNGYPMVRVTDVRDFYLETEASLKVGKEIFKEFTRRETPQQGDIVFTRVGSYGNSCLALQDGNFCLGQNTALIRPHIDPHYLLFCLKSPFVKEQIESSVVGSTQKTISIKSIKDLLIPIHSKEEIASISQSLSSLQTKIELNRKTNETLEAMAKALFKSWFVDFDPVRAKAKGRPTGLPAEISDLFPDSFEDSELGEIPKGWQCCPFTQLVDVISGGTPKTSVDEYWNGSIPWFSVVDAPSGADCWGIQTDKSITHLGLDNCSSKLLPIGTTIISARGTVGKVCLTGQDMAMNQSCYGLRSKAANGEFFCFYLTKSIVEILEARAHGSVFNTITRDTLDGVSTISPPLEVIQSFNSIAGALLGKIKNNLEESRILGNQRDALLPKLISGEIRIPDAEKMLEEVGF